MQRSGSRDTGLGTARMEGGVLRGSRTVPGSRPATAVRGDTASAFAPARGSRDRVGTKAERKLGETNCRASGRWNDPESGRLSKNHEGGLIYNKLTNSKEEEYKTVIDNFNDFLKGNKITIDTQKKLIEEERESLKNNTNTLNDILEIKEKITNEAIEYGRKEIISLCIGHLKANQMNSDGIKHLQKKINEINNSK